MNDVAKINDIKKKRFQYLKKVWDKTDGDKYVSVDMFETGKELGFDIELTQKIYQYLNGEGLLEATAIGSSIGITHCGVKEVEQALEHPDEPTEHFLPFNIINVIGNNNTILSNSNNNEINSDSDNG